MTTEEKYRRILANHLPPDKMEHDQQGVNHLMEKMEHDQQGVNHLMERMEHDQQGVNHLMDKMEHDQQGVNHLISAVEVVYNYLNIHRVHFHITRGRASKLGDYRWPQGEHNYHEMSINGDLNPYLFLWVFLHEAAHLETHLKHDGAAPHGHEWQGEYARLIDRHAALFPPEVQPLLKKYTRRIPLNRSLLRQIEEHLHHYDPDYNPEEHLTLDRLPMGSRFRLKNKPDILFESLERRRTRWLCRDTSTGRRYTVASSAEVIPE